MLRQPGPLALGDDPAQDVIRLTHVVAELPKIKAPPPVMVLPPDLVVAKLKTLIAEHHVAARTLGETSGEGKETQKKIMALRPRALKLWQEGLDAWIQANVHTQSGQVAFGRGRRHRVRKAAEQTNEEKSGGGKSSGDKTLTGNNAAPTTLEGGGAGESLRGKPGRALEQAVLAALALKKAGCSKPRLASGGSADHKEGELPKEGG